jgi:hypothetical protein
MKTDCKGQLIDTPTRDAKCSHPDCNVPATRIDGRKIDGRLIRWTCGNHEADKPKQQSYTCSRCGHLIRTPIAHAPEYCACDRSDPHDHPAKPYCGTCGNQK